MTRIVRSASKMLIIVDNTWTHWGEGNIRKRNPMIHHQRFTARDKIRNGPQVGELAT